MDEFNFNDEFFLKSEDRTRGEHAFPLVWFALHTPEASDHFVTTDEAAKAAKHRFQVYGISAVGLALIALVLSAIEPIVILPAVNTNKLPASVATAVAAFAALAGIVSVVIGWAGMGIAGRKHEWLKQRLIGERLRQWQAQYLCTHLPEIVVAARNKEGIAAYCRTRTVAFEEFRAAFIDNIGARLTEYASGETKAEPDIWVSNKLREDAERKELLPESDCAKQTKRDSEVLSQLFQAYDEIRFRGQVDYTAYMLGDGRLTSHPASQQRLLHNLAYIALTVILVFHTAVIFGVLATIPELKSPIVHALAVITALGALALRVLEDGLQPTAQLIRLRGYLAEISIARKRFSKTSNALQKREEMRILEEAAARELIDFMKVSYSARFIL